MHSAATAKTGYASIQAPLVGLQVALFLMAFMFCSLRTYSRILIVRTLGPDDYLMIAATVFSLGLTINSSLGTMYGWGLHIVDVLPEDISSVLLISWNAQILFTLTTSAVKISILTFYLRLASTKTYRIVIYASIAWLTIWCIGFLLVVIFQCTPVSAYWNPAGGFDNPHCFNANPALLVNGITNILNDLFVYILPMPMLWRIKLPKKQRIGLLAIFGFGSVVCVAGAMRLYYSIYVNTIADSTWAGFDLWTWEAVEVDLGISCACAPALKPLLIRWFPKFMGTVLGRTSNSSRVAGLSAGTANFIPMKPSSAIPGRANPAPRDPPGVYRQWADEERPGSSRGGSLPRLKERSEESLTDHSVRTGSARWN